VINVGTGRLGVTIQTLTSDLQSPLPMAPPAYLHSKCAILIDETGAVGFKNERVFRPQYDTEVFVGVSTTFPAIYYSDRAWRRLGCITDIRCGSSGRTDL